ARLGRPPIDGRRRAPGELSETPGVLRVSQYWRCGGSGTNLQQSGTKRYSASAASGNLLGATFRHAHSPIWHAVADQLRETGLTPCLIYLLASALIVAETQSKADVGSVSQNVPGVAGPT